MRIAVFATRLLLAVFAAVLLVVGITIADFLLRDPHIPQTYLAHQPFDDTDLQRMRASRVRNMAEVLADKELLKADTGADTVSSPASGATPGVSPPLRVLSPYVPAEKMNERQCQESAHCRYFHALAGLKSPQYPARRDVMRWWSKRAQSAEQAPVCALRFEDEQRTRYRLRTFASMDALRQQPDYQLTHYHACGACSTLQDLAIYAELDLTDMASKCSKLPGSAKKRQCMEEGIGFTPACAQVWAYNAERSAKYCKMPCIRQYGVWALLTDSEKRPADMSLENDMCLYCDAMLSEPGFQYAAGRSRRNSGIASEIVRDAAEVYPVAHAYWREQSVD